MSAWLFLMGLQLQGLVWALRARRRVGIAFCACAGLPLGLVAWVVLSLIGLTTPLPHTGPALFGLYAAALFVGTGLLVRDVSRRGGLDGREAAVLVAFEVVFGATVALFTVVDLTITTPDSLALLDAGRAFAFHGAIDDGAYPMVRGMFTTVAQGSSVLLGRPYLTALHPAMALSLAGLFVTLGARCLGGSARHIVLAALCALALLGPYMMLMHAFYLHTNMAAGIYLFGFAACFFLAEREGEPAWLAFAFVFLAGLALTRAEGPVVALLMIAIAFGGARVDERALARATTVFLCAGFAWQLSVWLGADVDSVMIDARYTGGLALLLLAAIPGLALLRTRPLERVRASLPGLALGALVLANAAAALAAPALAGASAKALLANATDPGWCGLWIAIALLGVGALVRPRIPGERVFAVATLTYLLLILLLATLRSIPYVVSWQDSGQRMLVHVAPIAMFWLLLAYGRCLDPVDDVASSGSSVMPTDGVEPERGAAASA